MKSPHHSAIALCAGLALFSAAPLSAGVVSGTSFDVDTQILGLELLAGTVSVDITTGNTGNVLSAADPDASLAQVALDVDLLSLVGVNLDLGILGVEWVNDTTFDLIFGLSDTSVEVASIPPLPPLSVPVPISLVPTIDWDVYNLELGPKEYITDVVQLSGLPTIPGGISWTDNSVSVTTDALVVAGLGSEGFSRFQIVTAVPVPATGLMLVGGLAAVGALARKKAKTSA